VEIQAGLFPNQETYGFLEPGASRTFAEYWIPLRKLDGISQAARDGVVHLERKAGALNIQLMATHAIAGAKAQVLCGGKALSDDAVALDPAKPWTRSIAAAPAGPCRFQLLDASGKPLLEYTEGEIRAAGEDTVRLGPQPSSVPEPGSPESGAYFESQGDLRKASDEFRKVLAKSPANTEARKAVGRLSTTMQRYEEAASLLASANDAEAHYYRGVALAGLGADEDARREWSSARADASFGVAAAVEIAAAMARAGDVQRAGSELTSVGVRSPRALVMQAAMARAAGDAAAAKSAVSQAAALDATDSAIRFEQVRQGASDPKLWEHLAADPERVLEIADLYMHWGRYKDALEALMFRYAPVAPNRREPGAAAPQDYALLAYYRGYCHQKLNEHFAEDFRGGSTLPVRYVFPNRPGERRILEAALQANPADANAHYLLGLWYLNAQLVTEGTRELQEAQKLRPELPEARALLAALKAPMAPSTAPAPSPTPTPPLRKVETPKTEPPKAESPRAEPPRAEPPQPVPAPPSGSPMEGSPLAGVPGWFSGRPVELVNSSLDSLAAKDFYRAYTYFTRANFPDAKQPEVVRWGYIEVQLQRVFDLAYAGKCPETVRGMAALGEGDQALPFTYGGFAAQMQTARFQFQLGLLEVACVGEKAARKRWEKVSKMKPSLTSPDFAYPYLALAKLGSISGLEPLVRQLDDAMTTAPASDQPALIYSRGLLLWAQGKKDQAAEAFRQGAAKAPPGMLRYLNQNALQVLTTR
jgi:tetratricopeptide (TPR) repeat protein